MITVLLATASATGASDDAVSVQTAALVLLVGGLCYCFKRLADLHRRIDGLATSSPAATSAAAASAPQIPSAAASAGNTSLSPEVLAVIAAAVHVAVGGRHRMVDVVRVGDHDTTPWSVEGRREVFRSHRVR